MYNISLFSDQLVHLILCLHPYQLAAASMYWVETTVTKFCLQYKSSAS
jgi:hypothetical protein